MAIVCKLNTHIYIEIRNLAIIVDWSFDCLPQNIHVKNITQQRLTSEGF